MISLSRALKTELPKLVSHNLDVLSLGHAFCRPNTISSHKQGDITQHILIGPFKQHRSRHNSNFLQENEHTTTITCCNKLLVNRTKVRGAYLCAMQQSS
jgi:hypothetical protein